MDCRPVLAPSHIATVTNHQGEKRNMAGINRRQVVAGALTLGAWSHLALAREIAQSSHDPGAPLDDGRILQILEQRIEARQAVGIAVGVLEGGRRRIITAGKIAKGEVQAVDGNTIFGIASVTKPFIALLLASAVLRGELEYEAAAERYLPGQERLPELNGRKITLLDLATHTSGLPHELPNEIAAEARTQRPDAARKTMYDHLASYALKAAPGSQWSYSNLGYAVLAHVLESAARLDYATLLRTRITDELSLSSTVPELTADMRERRAAPHLASLHPSPEWNKPWTRPLLQSSVNDLLTFVEACVGQKQTVLAPAIAAMLRQRRPAPALNAEQALGWYVYPDRQGPLVAHSGGGGGFAASVLFDQHAKTGVVLLSNTELLQEDVARHILRKEFPLNPIQTEIHLDPSTLDAYLGDYQDAAGAITGIRRQPDGLMLLMPAGHKAPLTPASPTSFFVRGYPGLTVSFDDYRNGRFGTVNWTLNGQTITARR